MPKYLYGARINGIQSYITETGKLKEIRGASQLLEQISAELKQFEAVLGGIYQKNQVILHAAGKIQYICNEQDCKLLVREFPKAVAQAAPGAQLSQAVVPFEEGQFSKQILRELEKRLEAQENLPFPHLEPALMITQRSARTGKAQVIDPLNKDKLDRGQLAKVLATRVGKDEKSVVEEMRLKESLFANFLSPEDFQEYILQEAFPQEFEDMRPFDRDAGNWMAVIHADGNNMGKLIDQVLDKKQIAGKQAEFLSAFSTAIGVATETAVRHAFEQVVKPVYQQEFEREKNASKRRGRVYLPMRPIILGGDDLTLVIRGSLALGFCQEYLKAFELATKKKLGELAQAYGIGELQAGLTACAGVAYIKFKFPFHYGDKLAGSLCSYAKKISKNYQKDKSKKDPNAKVESCLAFHRVLSSFIEEYSELTRKELFAKESNMRFHYGPYFVSDEHKPSTYATIDQLEEWVYQAQKEGMPRGALREWLTELKISEASAEQLLNRIIELNPAQMKKLELIEHRGAKDPKFKQRMVSDQGKEKTFNFTHIYDVIQLAHIHSA